MTTQYTGDLNPRRQALIGRTDLNGIDTLEIWTGDATEKTLLLRFINPIAAGVLAPANFRIDGGERIQSVNVLTVAAGTTDPAVPPGDVGRYLTLTVDQAGDFTPYTLHIVDTSGKPPTGFDPLLSETVFSFKVNCASDADCAAPLVCAPETATPPPIDYLARDYGSFRQLMLDRMSVLVPTWTERNVADAGIALVELLAYAADRLTYQQDAIATEAYLSTARRRVSVRRHARLVDYAMHDGSNARAWVQIFAAADAVVVKQGTQLFTKQAGLPGRIPNPTSDAVAYNQLLALGQQPFETLHDVTLYTAHNEISLYTWGLGDCCLPKGASRATLVGPLPGLRPGDVLIFQEKLDPQDGDPHSANPAHRHAVRLTSVQAGIDPLGTPPNYQPQAVVEIAWGADDALPFPLCLSFQSDPEAGGTTVTGVSVALGNIVLADHGRTLADAEPLPLPVQRPARVGPPGPDGREPRPVPQLPRYQPALKQAPLTQALPYDPANPPASAAAAMTWAPGDTRPWIWLDVEQEIGHTTWRPARDLLSSGLNATTFVVEVENDGTARLRFGDGQHEQRPNPKSGTPIHAIYRVGNGTAGNVGAGAIYHVVSDDSGVDHATNPLPARGGVEPESIERVRQYAPVAFRTQERCVTPEDYAARAQMFPQVQRAAASFRWTGSWRTVFITVDRQGGRAVDQIFRDDLRRYIEPYRMAGHDVEIDAPQFVSLEIEMHVCVNPDYFRSKVRDALLEIFSNRNLAGGRRGLFHPDNFTFGQNVYLSALIAAAQAVAGVDSLVVTIFQRQNNPATSAVKSGVLRLSRLEIARLDNDPNFPEHGAFRLILDGGK